MAKKNKEQTKTQISPAAQIESLRRKINLLEETEQIPAASDSFYNYLYNHLSDAAFIIDLQGRFVDVNQVAIDRLGYSREEFLTLQPQDVNAPPFDTTVPERMKKIFASGHLFFETIHVTKTGRRIPTEVSARLIEFNGSTALMALARDISERKEAEEKIRESERKYRELFENANDAIFILDKNYNYIDANRKAVELFGFSREEFLAMNVFDVIPPEQKQNSTLEFKKLPRSGAYEKFTGRQRTKDGRWLDIEVSSTAIMEHGEYVGSRDIVRDITERKNYERELLQAKEAAEAASKAKSEFLANMSHEIRTPLNGLLGMAHLLSQTPLSQEQREYLDLASLSGERLLQIINDILDFSKIEANKLEIEAIPFDLRTALENTLNLLQPKAKEKGISLIHEIDPSIPPMVIGDAGRLTQIIINLVDNAVKFTEQGWIFIGVRRKEVLPAGIVFEFLVQDTGIGIPADKQRMIFDSFTQADGSVSRRVGGTGLGLAISSKLAAMMNGRMWLQSPARQIPGNVPTIEAPDPGSAFRFTVTLGDWEKINQAPAPASAAGEQDSPDRQMPSFADCRILLAEDEQINRMLATTLLTRLDCQVTSAANGVETLQALEENQYDLILMDIQMPDMDGFSTTAAIREKERVDGGHIPIIALTAHAMQGDREKCTAAGMDGYLTKPISLSELIREMGLFLPKDTRRDPGGQGEKN